MCSGCMDKMETIIWYLRNIFDHVFQMLPCMGAALIVWSFLRPVRLRRLVHVGLVSPRRREAALLCFVLFCTGLCALTLFPYGFWKDCLRVLWDPDYSPEFVFPTLEESLDTLRALPGSVTPFREILRVHYGGPWLWFVLWGNIGMFLPVGFFLPLLWRNRKWYHAALAGGLFSLTIEFVQVFVGRVSDIDDVMLNTAGAILGFALYYIICKVIPLEWKRFHCQKKEDA